MSDAHATTAMSKPPERFSARMFGCGAIDPQPARQIYANTADWAAQRFYLSDRLLSRYSQDEGAAGAGVAWRRLQRKSVGRAPLAGAVDTGAVSPAMIHRSRAPAEPGSATPSPVFLTAGRDSLSISTAPLTGRPSASVRSLVTSSRAMDDAAVHAGSPLVLGDSSSSTARFSQTLITGPLQRLAARDAGAASDPGEKGAGHAEATTPVASPLTLARQRGNAGTLVQRAAGGARTGERTNAVDHAVAGTFNAAPSAGAGVIVDIASVQRTYARTAQWGAQHFALPHALAARSIAATASGAWQPRSLPVRGFAPQSGAIMRQSDGDVSSVATTPSAHATSNTATSSFTAASSAGASHVSSSILALSREWRTKPEDSLGQASQQRHPAAASPRMALVWRKPESGRTQGVDSGGVAQLGTQAPVIARQHEPAAASSGTDHVPEPASGAAAPAMDIAWVTEQVGRQIARRLEIEHERMGVREWRCQRN